MKDNRKKKPKAKKSSRDGGQHAEPVKKKKVYEMPPEYNEYLQKLTEMIDQREEYKRILPTLPPERLAEARRAIRELDKTLDKFEQKMAEQYDSFQRSSAQLEEAEKNSDEAFALLYESMQRYFIVMKHRLAPETFKSFEDKWVGQMKKEDSEQWYELIAHRESYDLENILADPDGRIKRPMKNPQFQMEEAVFEIERVAFQTPADFKELEADYEENLAIRNRAENRIWLIDPEHRPAHRKKIEELDRMLDDIKPSLMQYLQMCFAETGKIEVENPDNKKLDAAFAQSEVAAERLHLMYKHALPEHYEKFQATSFEGMTPEEIEDFNRRVAEREAKELDEILASLERTE